LAGRIEKLRMSHQVSLKHDLRSWLDKLEKVGELRHITAKVDWDGEIAEIQHQTMMRQGPALLFESIKGYEQQWCNRLFVNGLGTMGRIALMAGLPLTSPFGEVVGVLRRSFKQSVDPILVKTGPVKQNKITGRSINLLQLPVPKWHPHDGGRYINTWCAIVTQDPETGEHNVGAYRGMITAKNRIGLFMQFAQHWGTHYRKYQRINRAMPVAMVYGWDPSMVFTAGLPLPVNEYGAMGAIMGEPVPLVKCETSDILVPASAEIVIEGTVSPNPSDYDVEGPYGEGPGYYANAARRPTADITAITHRDAPIFRGSHGEGGPLWRSGFTALTWNMLEQQDIPGILDIEIGALAIIKIHKTYQGQARHIAASLWGSRMSVVAFKVVVIVDDEREINIHDPVQVNRIINSNLSIPGGVVTFPAELGPATNAALSTVQKDEFAFGNALENKLLIDATVDWTTHPPCSEWQGRRISPDTSLPLPETAELVRRRWQEYGI
jgi:4-hydroxy-3-polyprenylbenzoate decarboxylase